MMTDPVKHLGAKLRQNFSTVVQEPIGWSMIDALCRLDESQAQPHHADTAGQAEQPDDPAAAVDSIAGRRTG